ncbi:MAG: glycosyltransferase family 4 protein [Blastocatellia bacterium]|nr:glycosyltransferase family 4 protein [Blastocatellia bacterium]
MLRILYAAGPGDVIGTYRHWLAGQDDPSQVSMTYSGQFFDVCRELGAEGHIVASHATADVLRGPGMTAEHLVKRSGRHGLRYHLEEVRYGLRLVGAARRFQADVAIVAEGSTHWFVLRLLPLLGIALAPTIHCVLWPKFKQPRGLQRLLNGMAGRLFRRHCVAVMSASEDITQQVRELTDGRPREIVPFLPSYRKTTFAEIGAPPFTTTPFRVLFAGRVERNKGVFDMLAIAERFAAAGRSEIEFDLCGTGSALDELRRAVEAAGLGARFRLHGHCSRARMREMLHESHTLIVPTTTSFIEGFNQVVVESVLAGRPVITSSVCPALSTVRDAVVEVPPDDVAAYGDAILRLQSDREFYESKRRACFAYQEQFYDPAQGWGAALKRVAQIVRTQREIVQEARPISA